MDISTDPAQAVLRDFENVIWLTALAGFVLFGAWRFFIRSSSRRSSNPASEPEGMEESAPPAESGVPVAHFTVADLLFLPLVLVKYSVTLQLLAGSLAAVPGQAAQQAGLVENAPDAAELTESVPMEMSTELIMADMVINLVIIGLVLTMVQWVGRRDLGQVFGLQRFSRMRFPANLGWPALWIFGGAMVATPVVFLTSQQMPDLLSGIFGEEIEEQAAVQSIRDTSAYGLRILLIMNACLVAPLVEELVFRGYFYGIMKRYTGAMFAAFVTSAIFAVAHQSMLALLPLWGFALFLTFFYESSRCLWIPIGIHALFNAVNVILIMLGMGGDAPADGGG